MSRSRLAIDKYKKLLMRGLKDFGLALGMSMLLAFVLSCSESLFASEAKRSSTPSLDTAVSVASSAGVSSNPADFVQIHDGRFQLHEHPFVLRGTNYFGSWREDNTIPLKTGIVQGTVWQFYNQWDPLKVDADFKFLRSQLNATAVRIGTPALHNFVPLIEKDGFQPWYNPDGTITEKYKKELVQLADIAYRNNIRIQLCLLWNFKFELEANGDAFKPGGKMDVFYSNQVRSIAAALKNHPGVMAFSIGNEILVIWKLNGTHRSWYEARAGGFILRRMRDVRAVAPLQLITVDEEGASQAEDSYWWSPGPELAVLPDVDDSNGSRPFRLSEKVDYHGAHFYPVKLSPEDLNGGVTETKLKHAVASLKAYVKVARLDGKPISINEIGVQLKQTLEPSQESQFSQFEGEFYKRVLAKGQALGVQGVLTWLALPMYTLRPGHFVVESTPEGIRDLVGTGQDICVRITDPNGATQVIVDDPHYSLFTWGEEGNLPIVTPAGKALAATWPDVPLSNK